MKRYEITCTERVTLPPDHARKVMDPDATEKVYPVYTIDGERYISIKADTLGGTLMTRLNDLHVDNGELNAVPAPMRVDDMDVPRIYPDQIMDLTDITGQVPVPKKFDQYEYIKAYQRENIRFKKMNFNIQNRDDLKMIAWLEEQPEGVSNYLKRLVMQDMEKNA